MAAGAFAVVALAEPPEWLRRERPESALRSPVPRIRRTEMENLGLAPELSRLPANIQKVIEHGNCGEYPSRSEADWAVCVEMFRAGYGVDEIWMTMTEPSHGISEKFFEKGNEGEAYLELTRSYLINGSRRVLDNLRRAVSNGFSPFEANSIRACSPLILPRWYL